MTIKDQPSSSVGWRFARTAKALAAAEGRLLRLPPSADAVNRRTWISGWIGEGMLVLVEPGRVELTPTGTAFLCTFLRMQGRGPDWMGWRSWPDTKQGRACCPSCGRPW